VEDRDNIYSNLATQKCGSASEKQLKRALMPIIGSSDSIKKQPSNTSLKKIIKALLSFKLQ